MTIFNIKLVSITIFVLLIAMLLEVSCQFSPTTTTFIQSPAQLAAATTTSSTTSPAYSQQISITTNQASDVTANSVAFNGNVSGLNFTGSVSVSFEWGFTVSYGNATTTQSMTTGGNFSAPVTGLSANTTYHFRAKADSNGTVYGDDVIVKTYANTVQVKVAAGADDGFSGGDVFDTNDTWFEAGQPYNTWIRFTGINIPAGAVIDAAHLSVVVNRWDAGTSLEIYAESTKNPLPPTSITDHATRRRTFKGVVWTKGSSNLQWQNSPDLTPVIQELVNGYGYNNGVIQLLIDNNNSLNGAETVGNTFENTGYAPQLVISYH